MKGRKRKYNSYKELVRFYYQAKNKQRRYQIKNQAYDEYPNEFKAEDFKSFREYHKKEYKEYIKLFKKSKGGARTRYKRMAKGWHPDIFKEKDFPKKEYPKQTYKEMIKAFKNAKSLSSRIERKKTAKLRYPEIYQEKDFPDNKQQINKVRIKKIILRHLNKKEKIFIAETRIDYIGRLYITEIPNKTKELLK